MNNSLPLIAPDAVRVASDLFKSLGDPQRIKILAMLARDGEMSVSQIGAELQQSQPAVSHHLLQLKSAGLIEYRRDGKFNFYRLDPEGMHRIVDQIFGDNPRTSLRLPGIEVTVRKRPIR